MSASCLGLGLQSHSRFNKNRYILHQHREVQLAMIYIFKITALAVFTGSALACVHATGYVDRDANGPLGPNNGQFAQLWDNGGLICQGGLTIDQNNRYSVPCVNGYYWEIGQNLAHSWYGYGANHFEWDQDVQSAHFDCDACNGKTGKCQQCTSTQFDTYVYC
ncbi:hypothetical protein GQ53DRAFT_821480 [Thozetella sp. PMI_491]|nr:hypothetical protein GQ53DRAFT_821480 [Thozetella sp. PMI_491]